MKIRVCSVCGSYAPAGLAACPACASSSFLGVARDAVVWLSAGFPCAACGRDSEPLVFRGWVRLTGLILTSHELRTAGYLCPRCANRTVAGALVWTGLLGWWSI